MNHSLTRLARNLLLASAAAMSLAPCNAATIQFLSLKGEAAGGPGVRDSQTAALEFVQIHSGVNYSDIRTLTPSDDGQFSELYQEFITGRISNVPEPAPLLMSVSGLLMISFGYRRRKSRASNG